MPSPPRAMGDGGVGGRGEEGAGCKGGKRRIGMGRGVLIEGRKRQRVMGRGGVWGRGTGWGGVEGKKLLSGCENAAQPKRLSLE